MIAFQVIAVAGLMEACASTRRNTDVTSGGQSDVGNSGRSGARGGSAAADVTDGGAANEPTVGGNGGAAAPSIDEGLAGAAGETGGLGPGATAPSYFQAGTRLQPMVLRGGGLEVLDSTAQSNWYDSQTGEPCLFRKGSDGVERCFPRTGSNDLTDYYLDAACTKPVFVGSNVNCDGTEFNYVSYGPYSGTDCTSSIYRLGAPLPQSVELFSNAAGSCRSMGSPKGARPLEQVPPETFVAVERVSRPRLPNMNAWVREGADGSWQVTAFHDPSRNAACSGLGPASSTDACIPSWVEPSYLFADSSCTRRVAYSYGDSCGGAAEPVALLERGETGDACGSIANVHGLWETTIERPSEFFELATQGCSASSLVDAKTYVQGAPIDLASLPKLEIIQVGSGSLRLPYYGFEGEPFFPVPGAPFLEAESGDTCQPQAFSDRITRCVSSRFELVSDYDHYYKTADCSGDLVYPWFNACNRPAPVGIVIRPFGCAKAVTQTLEFDGTVSTAGGLFHPTPSSSCQDSGFVAGEGAKWFRATKPVDPADRFVPFERLLGD